MPFSHAIADETQLRERYGASPPRRKVIDHVDVGARDFIDRSPFVILATSSATGCDASPRGGPPGFVEVLDEHRLAIPDLAGNRLLDSYGNIVANPAVGLLFLIPGLDETLRVNGRATLTTDPEVLERCPIEGRSTKVAVGIDVDEVYIHCAKAFRRSGLWSPDQWPSAEDRPSVACILRDHLAIDVEPARIEEDLEKGYAATMWEAGG